MTDDVIGKLSEIFKRFPGIGPKQAKRFIYYLLRQDQRAIETLITLLSDLKKNVHQCQSCFRYFSAGPVAKNVCETCADQTRDSSTLMLVEKDVDLETIKRSGSYSGQFFVLGGLIPILEEHPDQRFRQSALIERIEKDLKNNSLTEVIIALSANREGDNTVEYLERLLKPYTETTKFRLSLLGRGLSTGSEIEYSDSDTLKNALTNRHTAT